MLVEVQMWRFRSQWGLAVVVGEEVMVESRSVFNTRICSKAHMIWDG